MTEPFAPLRHVLFVGGVVLVLAAGSAAQAQAGAAGSALSAPAQARTATPAPAATVKPGIGGGVVTPAPAQSAELAAAIASGNLRRALELGATPRDIVLMMRTTDSNMVLDPDRALFVRAPDGQFAVAGFNLPPATDRSLHISTAFIGYVPPAGLASLPGVFEAFGPPNPGAGADLAPAGRLALSGAAPRDVAAAILAARPTPPGALPLDSASARLIQDPTGGVAVVMTRSDGHIDITHLPDTESFSGLAGLPTMEDALPGLKLTVTPKAP